MARRRGGARAAAAALAVLACVALWWAVAPPPTGPRDGAERDPAPSGGTGSGPRSPAVPTGSAPGDRAPLPPAPPPPEPVDDRPFVGGHVRDPGGAPVAGARVRALAAQRALLPPDLPRLLEELLDPPPHLDEAVTDASGAFALRRLREGTVRLAAEAAGFAGAFTPPTQVRPAPGGGPPVDLVLGAGHPLEGRVLRADGTGAPDVPVSVFPEPGDGLPALDVSAARTDGEGKFRVAALAAGRYVVAARAPGHPVRVESGVAVPGHPPVVLRLDGTATLDVFVTDAELRPVEGAVVLVAAGGRGGELAGGRTDGSGRLRLEHLAAGRVDLASVRAPGFAHRLGASADSGPPELAPGATTKWHVALVPGARIRGRVLDRASGEPVPGASVRAMGARGFIPAATAATVAAEDGSFLLTGVPAGNHMLLAAADGWVAAAPAGREAREAAVLEIAETDEEVERDAFLDRAASLSGRVIGPGERPVAGAQVGVSVAPGGPGGDLLLPGTRTAADGSFHFAALPPGRPLGLSFEAGGLLPEAPAAGERLTLDPGEHRADLVFHLAAGATVRGRAVGVAEAPLAGVVVTATPEKRRGPRTAPPAPGSVATGPDGRFVIHGLPPGIVDVVAALPGHVTATARATATADAPAEVLLRLAPAGAIEGRVLDGDGAPLGDARVSVLPEDGDDGPRSVATAPDGSFRVEGLPLGTPLHVTVDADDRAQGTVVGAIAEGPALEIRLEAGLVVRGTVVDEDGNGLPRLTITAHPAGQGAARSAQADGEGRFEIGRLPRGEVTLVATGRLPSADLAIAPLPGVEAGALDVVYTIRRGITVTGIVRFADDAPAAQARVTARPVEAGIGPGQPPGVRADGDGAFTLRGLVPGERYLLTASGDGMLEEGGVEVDAGATGVRLRVGRAQSLAGEVIDAAGAPVPRAVVHLRGARRRASTRADGDGRFRFPTVEPGPVEVLALRSGEPPEDAPWTPTVAGAQDLRLVVHP